jgi:hypothetical protein
VYILAGGWEQTPLVRFQATHDTKKPVESRSVPKQNEILLSVAQQMKEAALVANHRFRNQPSYKSVFPDAQAKTVKAV